MKSCDLPIASIRPSALNARKHFDEAALADMAASIKTHGLLQPLVVRPQAKGYELVCGERRYRACKIAGLRIVPASIRALDDLEALETMCIENDQRQDLNPMECAESYKRILSMGRTAEELAARIGRSAPTVYEFIKLLDLPPAGRRAVETGALTRNTAVLIARVPGVAAREKACAEVLAGGEPMSYREAKAFVSANFMVELKQAPFSLNDKTLLPKAARLRQLPEDGRQQPQRVPRRQGRHVHGSRLLPKKMPGPRRARPRRPGRTGRDADPRRTANAAGGTRSDPSPNQRPAGQSRRPRPSQGPRQARPRSRAARIRYRADHPGQRPPGRAPSAARPTPGKRGT